MATETGWERAKEPMGIWEHRGKVAFVGRGHSTTDRRWDGVSMDKSLGAYTMIAVQAALEDAGLTLDDVDGIVTSPGAQTGTLGGGAIGDSWGPVRDFFEPPYDSEDGLTLVTGEWLKKQMGMKNVKYINSHGDYLWRLMGLAVQAVGDGRCEVCIVPYPTGNLEGRYHQTADTRARGGAQWQNPWGWGLVNNGFVFDQYTRKYGGSHDGMAPFIINQRTNGLNVPWGYYTLHENTPFTAEDYLAGRMIASNLSIFDCDRPVQAAACYVVTTAERAKDMKQKPVYVLDHTENNFSPRSLTHTLEEIESFTDTMARKAYSGSGLKPDDIDIFSPYDGFAVFTQYFTEAFQWRGVKRGDAHAFYAGDITPQGPNPFNTGGGNMGTGRMRTVYFTDGMEQLQGRAGERQVPGNPEVYVTIGVLPFTAATMVLSSKPS